MTTFKLCHTVYKVSEVFIITANELSYYIEHTLLFDSLHSGTHIKGLFW